MSLSSSPDLVIYETKNTENYSKPSKIQHAIQVRFSAEEGKREYLGYGKWLMFKHFDEIDKLWEKIRKAIANGELEGCTAKCTTARYNPTKHGPGPRMTAAISVYTEESNVDAIGFKLIEIAKQDLRYKTNEATKSYRYVHAGSENIVSKTIFWNSGKPSLEREDEECYGTSPHTEDRWRLNVVMAPEPIIFREDHYRWILKLEYKETTKLWHLLKDVIESKENFSISKMVCPPKEELRSAKEKPVFHIYSSKENSTSVSKKLMKLGGFIYESMGILHTEAYSMTLASKKREQHMKAYEKAITEKLTVEIRFVRFNYVGLPRSGKTSFLRRILGEILNILEAQLNGEAEQPSTGVAEEGRQVIIRPANTEMGAIWSADSWSRLSWEEETRMLFQWIRQIAHDTESYSPVERGRASSTARDAPADEACPKPLGGQAVKPDSSVSDVEAVTPETADTGEHETDDGNDILSVFNKVMESEDWDRVKHELDGAILLSKTDTGGHVEFLDLHAALVHGPSFNLIFRRLTDQLNSEFKVHYTRKESKSTKEEDSILTVEDIIFQTLSCIAGCCSSSSVSTEARSDSTATYRSLKSKAMIVGTFLDVVSEEEFKERDEFLRTKIKNTDFFNKNIIEFAFEDQLMLGVNNMSGKKEEIDHIRSVLSRVIERHFKKVPIPASWLIFSLYLRSLKRRTISLEECEKMASKIGIDRKQLQDVLWFLHHHAGILLYYPALKDTVICDARVVYDSATNLIENTFTFEKVGKRPSERFEKKAQFSASDVEEIASIHTDDLIPLEKLVELFKHLNILTTLPSSVGDPTTYFMPCVLKSARGSEMSVPRSESDPAPLMIRYECGYTPTGLSSAVIANLLSRQHDWEVIDLDKGLHKNKVQFYVGKDYDKVTLLFHPQYIEITVSRHQSHDESRDQVPHFQSSIDCVCSDILNVIKSILKNVTARWNFQMEYKFGFKCPIHREEDHLCMLNSEEAIKMLCLTNITPIALEYRHKVWFSSNFEDSVISPYLDSLPDSTRRLLEQQLDWNNEGVDKDLTEIAHHMLDWEERLCTHLELTEVDIRDIKTSYPQPELQRRGALRSWKRSKGRDATYRNLLEVFVKAKHSQCAEAVCKVLKKKATTATCQGTHRVMNELLSNKRLLNCSYYGIPMFVIIVVIAIKFFFCW